MCDAIRHRGPDDEGYLHDGPCALGMRRLSIIDLSTGHQPISNEDESVWVVFNGEIYNYRRLRADLIRDGHRFATNSDTETLVHLYEQDGVEGFNRLQGMFALAIWDKRRRQLLLARDRFGKKPLYYSIRPEGIYFGSELKCLRAAGVPLEPDPEALKLYLQFGYIPDPWSVYRGVGKLSPGGWLTCDQSGRIEEGRYWRLPAPASEPPGDLTEEEAGRRVRDLFDESVRMRMIADVPLGAFLSGGIDSGSVVASMALQSGEPIKTFSIGFEEPDYSELSYAEAVARQYKTDHHAIIVRPDSASLIPRLVRQFDEPFGDSSAIPTFIVSELAAKHVKVVLSGDGGDELFGGYTSFFMVEKLRYADRIPQFVRRFFGWLSERLPYSTRGINRLRCISRPTALERYFESNYASYLFRRQLLNPEWLLPSGDGFLLDRFAHCLLPEGTDALLQAFYFEATANLTGDMLVKVDRMSMANSLEVRCPLLDHRLAELAARFPPIWKMRGGRGKSIFLKAVGDRLPPEILNRPKRGFAVPLAHWFQGELKEFLHDHLLSPSFLDRGIVSPPFLRYLIDEHMSGRRRNDHWLWRLLALELWWREQSAPLRARA
jgi:asparagine synthase (glutamine-hydrolysing)